MNNILSREFYLREAVDAAKDLLGKKLVTCFSNKITSGIIVETEAYSQWERGCHAFRGMTKRNATLFEEGGIAYVYLCYGVYNLFNVVTHVKGKGEGVLIRALQPLDGLEAMKARSQSEKKITSGPGKLTIAMGIELKHNEMSLQGNKIWIEEAPSIDPKNIQTSERIGLGSAGEDAHLPWRFSIKENKWVSR